MERLEDKIYDLQRSLRRQQRSKETAPGTLCMITYLDFAECVHSHPHSRALK